MTQVERLLFMLSNPLASIANDSDLPVTPRISMLGKYPVL
ncbi:hypothetical protein T06_11715 [Trichinella sp. T6]|nr:hypothetical protein T06_11715 [Trichinella sp. T6]